MSNINVNNLTPLLGSGSSVSLSGSLVVKNDVTIGGHLYIGDANTDSVTFSAEVSSSVVPDANITYDLGSSAKKWKELYLNSLVVKHITASGNISASGTGVNGTGSFHHMDVNGNITASGTGSFQQGVTANQSSSFTYISMSGALKTAYHVSASKLQLTETAEIYGSASMGYISSSGDLTASGTGSFGGGIDSSTATGSFGQVTAVGDVSSSGTGSFMDVFIDDNLEVQGDVNLHGNISGSGTATASFGHISASGDISTSTAVHSVQYYTDSLIFATGDQALNTVKLGGGASVTQIHGLSIDVSGSISMSGDMTLTGDISSSGRISASGGFETDGSSNFGSISMSGAIVTSGHISASRVSASAGFEADTLSTSSFGNISASGNISTSAHMHAVQYFTDSLIFATGDQALNTVKLGGASSVTQLHGLSIDVTGSISMSGDMTLTGDISSSGRISASSGFETDAGTTSNFGTISSSGNLIISGHVSASRVSASAGFEADSDSKSTFGHISMSGDLQVGNNTVVISGSIGEITASGNISGGAQVYGGDYYAQGLQFATQADSQTSGVLQIGGSAPMRITGTSLMVTGSVSMSGALSMSGANSDLTIDQGNIVVSNGSISTIVGSISASEHLIGNLIQQHTAGVTNFAVDALGQVTASGQISSSAGLAGTALTLATNGVNALTVSTAGALSASSTLAGTALTLGDTGVNVATVDTLGNISGSGTGSFVSLNVTDAGVAKFNVDTNGHVSASGKISSSGTLAGTALDIRTDGVQKAVIDTSGNLDLIAGNEAGATGSFGYISMSGDFTASGNITASGVYADGDVSASGAVFTKFIKPNAGATLNITPDTGAAFASDTHTVQIYGGVRAGINAITQHLFTGQITSSGTASFAAGMVETGNIHSTGTVYAPFYSNYHAVTNNQVLTVTSSGVPIVVTGASIVTLPAVAIGHSYWIINGNADGTIIKISPNANDKFIINAAGAAGTDDKDLELTAGTAETGDYVKISYASGDGWIINERAGTWADQA